MAGSSDRSSQSIGSDVRNSTATSSQTPPTSNNLWVGQNSGVRKYPARLWQERHPPRQFERARSGVRFALLIGQLSNWEFVAHVDQLLEGQSRSVAVRVRPEQVCACGCGAAVVAPRKFVNQEHYSAWLSRVRIFGRNRTLEAR